MSRKVMSSRGTIVDFDLLKAKEKMGKKSPSSKVDKKKPTVSPETMRKLLIQSKSKENT